MPHHVSLEVALIGLFGLALLVLSVIEFRKPSPVAKMTGLGWLLFGVAADSFSALLFILESMRHLPKAQKPWLLVRVLYGVFICFTVIGTQMLVRMSNAKDAETKREAEEAEVPYLTEGVWPPPPTGP